MFLRPRATGEVPAIDLTPIIDMVFLLLIFFLVATTFQQQEREMEIVLPAARSAAPISVALRELIVNVDSQEQLTVGGRRISSEELEGMVGQLVQANRDQKVTVRGDRRVGYAAIVRVLDICKAKGIQQPFLDTVPIE